MQSYHTLRKREYKARFTFSTRSIEKKWLKSQETTFTFFLGTEKAQIKGTSSQVHKVLLQKQVKIKYSPCPWWTEQ